MKGNPKVIDPLTEALRHELTAINQHRLHYRLLDDWASRTWQSCGAQADRAHHLPRRVC